MKDTAIRALEDYILSGKNLEEGLKRLVEGTEAYNYLKSIDILTRKGLQLNVSEKAFIEDYAKNPKTDESKKISLRYDLMRYEVCSEEEKGKLLDKLAKNSLGVDFHPQRPSGIVASQPTKPELLVQQAVTPLLDRINLENEIQKLYKREKAAGDFHSSILANVDFEKLTKEEFYQVLNSMKEDIILLNSDKFYIVLVKWMIRSQKETGSSDIDSKILNNMTTEQMEKLLKIVPFLKTDSTFFGIFFSKKFQMELSKDENLYLNFQEKRINLIKMLEFTKSFAGKMKSLSSALLLEILENGLRTENYDEGYFLEYLMLPVRPCNTIYQTALNAADWNNLLSNVQAEHNVKNYPSETSIKDKELFSRYLEEFFKKGEKIDKYGSYLDVKFLTSVWEDFMLTSGKTVEGSVTNSARLDELARSVGIKLVPSNKDLYSIGEDIILKVEIKNVPTLYIKVFEINTENYYRKDLSLFKTDINLDGLVASIEKTMEFKQSPQIKFIEELKFPELKGKSGLFIIELIGNSRSSRAVMKIGILSYLSMPTIKGQLCYVLDGEKKVCSHSTSGIWVDKQLYKAEADGKIFIPYLPPGGNLTSKAILLHRGLAQLIDLARMEEKFTLKCGFFMLPESFITGNVCTIAISPQLLLNDRTVDISLMKNIHCVLKTSNCVDGITSTKDYNNLSISANKELLIQFRVLDHIKEVNVEFNADVNNSVTGGITHLSSTHLFEVITHHDDFTIGEMYLRLLPNDKGYELRVLGKNGEPISNANVQFSITCPKIFYKIEANSTTNQDGNIWLGKLQGVTTIVAILKQANGKIDIRKSWVIPKRTIMQYPTFIDIIENEIVDIPISQEMITEKYFLKKETSAFVLEDCTKNTRVIKNDSALYATMRIEGLKNGIYKLCGIDTNAITIRVHRGIYWPENPSFILKQYSLIENSEKKGFIKIHSVKHEVETGKIEIKIDSASRNNWRVHMLLFRHLPENLNDLTMTLLSKDTFASSEYYFQRWHNFYLSNRQLSSEFKYCFDRKHSERFTGNTLDKPKLLLKRVLTRTTEVLVETVTTGSEYKQEQETFTRPAEEPKKLPPQMLYECHGQERFRTITRSQARGYDGSQPYNASYNPYIPQSIRNKSDLQKINSYGNFIGSEPLTFFNLPANDEGKIIIELDKAYKEKYSTLVLIAVDEGSVAHYIEPLTGSVTKNKDISLNKPLNNSKDFCEMRTVDSVEKYGTYLIDDTSSSDFMIVDTLRKTLTILKALMNQFGCSTADLDKCEQVINWNLLTEEEKNKLLSRYSSHELNFFIYKKDPEYFRKVVKPYLQNKMEKTFIDYYLLEDTPNILKYAENLPLENMLNPLEKALLVEVLVKADKKEHAIAIANRMHESLNNKKKKATYQIKIFETILSLNNLKPTVSDIPNSDQKLLEVESQIRQLKGIVAENW